MRLNLFLMTSRRVGDAIMNGLLQHTTEHAHKKRYRLSTSGVGSVLLDFSKVHV